VARARTGLHDGKEAPGIEPGKPSLYLKTIASYYACDVINHIKVRAVKVWLFIGKLTKL
jgi:hypothetical protein